VGDPGDGGTEAHGALGLGLPSKSNSAKNRKQMLTARSGVELAGMADPGNEGGGVSDSIGLDGEAVRGCPMPEGRMNAGSACL
jgi:hypothetical protein